LFEIRVIFGAAALASVVSLAPAGAQTFIPAASLAPRQHPATLVLDARQASRGIIYARETIPARAGDFTIVYPKWIPGEHGPTGPLGDLAAMRVSAGGSALRWRRDLVDMYEFHVDVPKGVQAITVDFDVLLNAPGDTMSTHSIAVLNWNRALLYQSNVDSHQYFVKPSIELPDGWSYGTALRDAARDGDRVDFEATSLAMLVDSPLDMGEYVKKWDLWKDGSAYVQLDAFADDPKDLDFPHDLLAAYEHVPAEAFALYGSRHFADYHALLTLSDAIGFQGIEHHQSSDNRAPEDFLTNSQWALADGDLVTHEFSHSWNGKYRRPADLTTSNFQVPQKTDLLWVYEGMNQYLGDLLSFRSGIRKPSTYPEYLASIYAEMAYEPGRDTTPLIDLTIGAPYYYKAHGEYPSIRRTAGDFYTEGELLWLDVDTIIRRHSHGARSLDTFLHDYTLPAVTGPITKTYTRAQIESLLDRVQPYDWHAFFQEHVYEVAPEPPSDELQRSGWKLIFNGKPNEFIAAREATRHQIDRWFDIGTILDAKGVVRNVREDSAAWKAGLAPGETIVAVNGRSFDESGLEDAVRAAQHSNAPISLIVTQNGWYQTLSVNYHDGIRYPHLQRIPGTTDMLAQIMAPHRR
jgi:predicted metalloprotease with PDZ domain